MYAFTKGLTWIRASIWSSEDGVVKEVFSQKVDGFSRRNQIQISGEDEREEEMGWEGCIGPLLGVCGSRLAGGKGMCGSAGAGTGQKGDLG